MNREEFLKRFHDEKTVYKYTVVFRKFDQFLGSRNLSEDQFVTTLNDSETHMKYNLLQELTFFLSETLSPRSTRNYFDGIFKYLLFVGCNLSHEQRNIRVQFPRITKKMPEGLDKQRIAVLLACSNARMRLYQRVLGGGGFREAEALQLKPRHIEFENSAIEETMPVRVIVEPEIAKFGIGRETFLPPTTAFDLQSWIRTNMIGLDDYIFTKRYKKNDVSWFGQMFDSIRRKSGLQTAKRAKHEHNQIKLHSYRAWFITQWTELGHRSFGEALAGHTKDLSVYYRLSPSARIELYKKYQCYFDF